MVCEFGVDVLSPEQKTPFLQYVLYTEKERIKDFAEYRNRSAQSKLTEDRIRQIVFSVTNCPLEADKAASYLVLQETKPTREQ